MTVMSLSSSASAPESAQWRFETTGQVKSSRFQLGVVCNPGGTRAPVMHGLTYSELQHVVTYPLFHLEKEGRSYPNQS